ncbi:MAG: SDR family oxidoreductase [Rhodospirillales bacterium]|nr:SDR family oxidoreductase [Rhodospirillales bacterium]
MVPKLFCYGLGYSALVLARRLMAEGWDVAGTCQSEARKAELRGLGIDAHIFGLDPCSLEGATHLLSSVPPDGAGDAAFKALPADLSALQWIGYLSTTGVYGDTGGATVDETAPLHPTSTRALARADAEKGWLDRGAHIFRLAGIYGPGRNPLERVQNGTARSIHKPGHAFGRIHVEDIAGVLMASMAQPDPREIYNVCDDEPAAPADVTAFACGLLGVEPPPLVSFDEAALEMSPMALSFWRDNRRVDNSKIKRDLGVTLQYPTYREGLRAILKA